MNFCLTCCKPVADNFQHRLVSNVHKLNCFFRIWKTDAFWCRDPTNKFVSLPLSVQARLRNIARQGARFIEHDILRELDEILAQQGTTKPDERLAIWASLWQLILIYRETLAAFKKHMGRLAKVSDEFDPIGKHHRNGHCPEQLLTRAQLLSMVECTDGCRTWSSL